MNKEQKFRAMITQDLPTIIQLENAGHEYPWTPGIFEDCLKVGYVAQVFASHQEIISYGLMSIAVEEAHIFNVCVNRQQRRKGYGQKMMNHLIDIAKKKKVNSVFLEVRPSNITAIRLYENMGFNEIALRENYYPANTGREDALVMAMDVY